MQFKQLEALLEVAKHKSFTLAAGTLFVSQPTISTQIAELEKEVGGKLLVRSTREVDLTPLGREFVKGAAKLLEMRDQLADQARNFYASEKIQGLVRIGASTAPSKQILPQWLADLAKSYPDLSFSLSEGDSRQINYQVLENQLELGIVGSLYKKRGLEAVEIFRDELVFIGPKNADYIRPNQSLKLEPNRKIPFIEREQGSGTRQETAIFLNENRALHDALKYCAQLPSNEAVVEAVIAGLGCAIVAGIAAQAAIDQGQVVKIKDLQPRGERSFYLIYKNRGELSPQARVVADYILERREIEGLAD